MKLLSIKKMAAVTGLGVVAILGTSIDASAQRSRRNDQRQERKIDKQQEKILKQRAKIERQRDRLEQERKEDYNRRVIRSGKDRSNGNGYYNGNANANTRRDRYRVYRNGAYYNTDQRGADLLRQAVNAGYQQGFEAGRNDRYGNRRGNYSNSTIYQRGTYGYQSYVNQSQYQYYFRQGFERGYQDGASTQYADNYNGQYQYGYRNNGSMSILGTILSQILNIQQY